MGVDLSMTLIEPRRLWVMRGWYRWRNRFLPPIAQLVIGILEPES